MISIRLTGGDETIEFLGALPRKLREALTLKIGELTELLYDKVEENLSGKLLQVKSGQLHDSIVASTSVDGPRIVGSVEVVPATPKALALEYGGKGSYVIPVGAKGVLANRETGFFSKSDVVHPPAKEYAYLRSALREIRDLAEDEMIEMLDRVIVVR